MWIISTAMKRPITIVAAVLSMVLVAVMAITSMKQDIFPDLKIPAIYVIQGYGGMSPEQMEGYITSTYELYFLYVPGIEHIESKSIQNVAVIKVFFQPDTDMASAMAAVVAMANRATSLMPHGTYNRLFVDIFLFSYYFNFQVFQFFIQFYLARQTRIIKYLR